MIDVGRIVALAAFLIWSAWPATGSAQSQADKTGTGAAAGQEELVAVGALSVAAVVAAVAIAAAIGTAVAVASGDSGDTVTSTQTN